MDPHSDAKQRLKQKREVFDAFASLSDSDDEVDAGRRASEAAIRKDHVRATSVSGKVPSGRPLPRSSSDSNLVRAEAPPKLATARSMIQTSQSIARPQKVSLPRSLVKSASDITPSAALSSVIGKRKRNTGLVIPDEQQIFRGLRFYFFPNNNTNPARRKRIAKAEQFGATWIKAWDLSVTHAVLDRDMDVSLCVKFLRLERIPDEVVLVSEDYPAECIAYRALVDSTMSRFAVKGLQRQIPVALADVEPVSTIDSSPPLKPPTNMTSARPPITPSPQEADVAPATQILITADVAPATQVLITAENVAASKPQQAQCEAPDCIADSFDKPSSTVEFEEAIAKAKALQDVPWDDDDAENRPTSSEGPVLSDQEETAGPSLLEKCKSKVKAIENKFQCMQKHTGPTSDSPNLATINVLQQMADYYGELGDEWRLRAYRKAIATLRTHPTKVCSKDEAAALPNIGDRLATKIEEIAYTSRLRRLDNARAEPEDQVLRTFMQVYGAGFATASKWVSQGYTTLDDLVQNADLTENQRIGIEHYEDFNTRTPRAEVEQHGNMVRSELSKIDTAFQVIVGGSYRRGASNSGDIDCIITRPDSTSAHIRNIVLGQLVPRLTASGFLVAALAATSKDDGSKWHGASVVPGSRVWRRLDMLLVPSDELGAALIYFTGNDIFNRSLRLLASTKGMRLNHRGLYKDVMRGRGREKLTEGTLVEGKDEKRIFEALGVPWRPPEHRIIC